MAEPRWFRDWCGALERNVNILRTTPEGAGIVDTARGVDFFSSRRVAKFVRWRMPYRFDGATHRISDLHECDARGYGACADGAALAAAAFALAGNRDVHLCYEVVDGLDGYAHARAVVGRRFVEPWPDHRRPEAKECSMLVDVLAVLRS